MIDQPAPEPTVHEQFAHAPDAAAKRGRHLGPLPLTPVAILVALAFIGSIAYIGWVVVAIDEQQIPLLAAGFVVLGATLAVMAIGSLVGMWRAASRADGRRALLLAIFGGLAGMAAIACFTVTALSAMLWTT